MKLLEKTELAYIQGARLSQHDQQTDFSYGHFAVIGLLSCGAVLGLSLTHQYFIKGYQEQGFYMSGVCISMLSCIAIVLNDIE